MASENVNFIWPHRVQAGSRDGCNTEPSLEVRWQCGDKHLSVIDLAAMSQSDHHNQEHIIGNGVDDAVVAHANPITRATSYGSGGWRSRVVGEKRDRALDAGANCWVEFP